MWHYSMHVTVPNATLSLSLNRYQRQIWYYAVIDTKYGNMLVTVQNVTLVPWLPYPFPDSLFINSLSSHVVFERFTDSEWQSIRNWHSRWFVEASCLSAGNSKTRKTLQPSSSEAGTQLTAFSQISVNNNYLLKRISVTLMYPIYL